ncbi:hypothetical protein FGB62_197g04 [Gracilaria domingensis]|nr:hypothetical protein FGB62_197g04 [Gracilaria domingensis]
MLVVHDQNASSSFNEIPEPDTGNIVNEVDTPLEPHNPEELYMPSFSTGSAPETDRTVTRNAAIPRRRIRSHTYFVSDSNAESIRLGRAGSSRNPENQLIPDSLPSCYGNCKKSGNRKYVRSGPPPYRNKVKVSLSLSTRDGLIQYILEPPEIMYFMLRLYEVLQLGLNISREGYRNLFLSFKSGQLNANRLTAPTTVDIFADTDEEGIVHTNYLGKRERRIEVDTTSGPLPEGNRARPLAIRAFTVPPKGLFRSEAPVGQLLHGHETYHMSTRNLRRTTVMYRWLESESKAAKMGAFLLLNQNGNLHLPYEMAAYIDARGAGTGRSR